MVQSLNGTRGKFLRVGHARVLLVSSNIRFNQKTTDLAYLHAQKFPFTLTNVAYTIDFQDLNLNNVLS